MSTEIPTWFDKDFLASVLQEGNPSKQVDILSYSAVPALAKGDNFCSIIIRVNVEFQIKGEEPVQNALIVKSPLPEGVAKELIEDMGLIDKECMIYKDLLPIMNKILNKSVNPKNYFTPRPGTLVLEDLKPQGYLMPDRMVSLGFDECNIAMKSFGVFHGLSVCVYKQHPQLIEHVGKELMFPLDMNHGMKIFLNGGYNTLKRVVEEWEGYKHFGKLLQAYSDKWLEKTIMTFTGKKHIRVLNHGDAWKSNFLFKYDETGKAIDVKLIDLQLSRFASPAIDLLTFINSSAKEEVKDNRLQELYSTYLTSFNSTLEASGCEERLTPEQFQDELDYASIVPFCFLPSYLPQALGNKEDMENFNDTLSCWINEDENTKGLKWKLMNSERYKIVAQYTLRDLERRGFFNSL